jgi:hypothetical protein
MNANLESNLKIVLRATGRELKSFWDHFKATWFPSAEL